MSELLPPVDRSNKLADRIAVLRDRYGFQLLDRTNFDDFVTAPGHALVMFTEELQKIPETWDLTIILPEAIKSAGISVRVGVLEPVEARALAVRYGFRIWPALVALRDGAYLGVIEGLKDWVVYERQIPALLAAEPCRPPSIGIAVTNAGTDAGVSACH